MSLFSITTLFYPDDYDPEDIKNLGKKVKLSNREVIINTDQITAFHANDKGQVVIHLSGGEDMTGEIPYKEFKEKMVEIWEEKDSVFVGTN